MQITEIISTAAAAVGFLVTVLSIILSVLKLRDARKQIKEAKTEEEKAAAKAAIAQANADLSDKATQLVDDAERLWKTYDSTLKASGLKSGPLKKDSVMNKLQAYAIEKNYTFDSTVWSEKVDNIVKLTKNVNVK